MAEEIENLRGKAKKFDELHLKIANKIEQLFVRRINSRRKAFLTKKPVNCEHRVKSKNSKVRCSLFGGTVCDQERSNSCSQYSCRNTKANVDQKFYEIVSDPIACSKAYPKIAILLWCIHQEDELGKTKKGKKRSG